MISISPPILENSIIIGCVSGACLILATAIYNRIARRALPIFPVSLPHSIWIAWVAAVPFVLVTGGGVMWSRSLLPPDLAAAIPYPVSAALRVAFDVAITLCLLILTDLVAVYWQLRIRFRPALGLSLIHSAIMLSVGATAWLLLVMATTGRFGF